LGSKSTFRGKVERHTLRDVRQRVAFVVAVKRLFLTQTLPMGCQTILFGFDSPNQAKGEANYEAHEQQDDDAHPVILSLLDCSAKL
jgi:hypothetical protein